MCLTKNGWREEKQNEMWMACHQQSKSQPNRTIIKVNRNKRNGIKSNGILMCARKKRKTLSKMCIKEWANRWDCNCITVCLQRIVRQQSNTAPALISINAFLRARTSQIFFWPDWKTTSFRLLFSQNKNCHAISFAACTRTHTRFESIKSKTWKPNYNHLIGQHAAM